MSEEKQIEEMAKDICRVSQNCNDVCHPISTCNALKYAERAYEAGYRKQSEGEWLVDAWDNEKEEWVTIPYNKHLHADAYCSLCKKNALLDGAEFGVASNYCPHCGAKMKGGAE